MKLPTIERVEIFYVEGVRNPQIMWADSGQRIEDEMLRFCKDRDIKFEEVRFVTGGDKIRHYDQFVRLLAEGKITFSEGTRT
jgi:hypothetical protein